MTYAQKIEAIGQYLTDDVYECVVNCKNDEAGADADLYHALQRFKEFSGNVDGVHFLLCDTE